MDVIPYKVITGKGRENFIDTCTNITAPAWPEFMRQDAVCNKYWDDLYRNFPEYQFILIEPGSETILAAANSIPLNWQGEFIDLPDEGWDWAVEKGMDDFKSGRRPTLLCALQIVVPEKFRKQGISGYALQAMRLIGKEKGFEALIAPVRPTMKHRYPHTPMSSYIKWVDSKGIPKDPWMSVHARLGARIIKVCPQSMRIVGTVEQWEKWTGMRFPGSDKYIVPKALVPVKIDWDRNQGTYIEPNVWMVHDLK